MIQVATPLRKATIYSPSIYFVLVVLLVIQRLFWLLKFGIAYTDSDQTIMWQAVNDFAHGIFRAPCFYGQAYNPLVEPFLAAPLYIIGFPVWQALPLITSILAIMPVLLLASYFRKRGELAASIITLAVFLTLPPEYQMLTTISRGFVTGIALGIASLTIFMRLRNHISLLFSGLLLGLAFYANLTTVLLVPLFIPSIFPHKTISIKNAIFWVSGFLIGLSSFIFSAIFYNNHPEMIIHSSPSLQISVSSFVSIVSRLDSYFTFITPVVWRFGYVVLVGIPILTIYLFRKREMSKAITASAIFLIIIFSMFSNKAADGTNSIFFSGSRMYLAYPFMLVFLLNFLYSSMKTSTKRFFLMGAIISIALSLTFQMVFANNFIRSELRGSKNKIVQVESVSDLKEKCRFIQTLVGSEKTLVISTQASVVPYGCPCILDRFPPAIVAGYERRTWLTEKYKNTIFNRIIICDVDSNFVNRFSANPPVLWQLLPNGDIIALENNLTTQVFLKNQAFNQ